MNNEKKVKKRIRDREYQRKRRADNPGLKAEESMNYRRKNPEKVKAHKAVNQKILSHKIKRSACEVCGKTEVHAHHDDYSKPLNIRWLCPVHHKAVHV